MYKEIDNPAIRKPVLSEDMLHDDVVAVRVDADVAVACEGEFHDAAEDTVRAVFAAHAVNHMIG